MEKLAIYKLFTSTIREYKRRNSAMKTRKKIHKEYLKNMQRAAILLLLLGTVFSCGHHEEKYHSVKEKIEAKSKNYHGTSITSEPYTEGLKTIEITEGGHTFLIPERKSQIQSYACTECHTEPLEELKGTSTGSVSVKKAHWNITLKHANPETMNCVTCHNGDDMDNLKSLTGAKVDFNNSYKVCNQCHTKQFEDWKGGAHGKRIGSWAPPRASKTCVNCHNPHSPSFEKRWPAKYNTQKVQERK